MKPLALLQATFFLATALACSSDPATSFPDQGNGTGDTGTIGDFAGLQGACARSAENLPPPTPPALANDPAFAVNRLRKWYLIGNALTAGHDILELQVAGPAHVSGIRVWINGQGGHLLDRQSATAFGCARSIASLKAGVGEVLLAVDGKTTAFARLTFTRSHPFYVSVSNDWDSAAVGSEQLKIQEELHTEHPALRMTHFVGPYTFTDPELLDGERKNMSGWVRYMRDRYTDEIGLHIHPYCNFLEQAKVTCLTKPSYSHDKEGDASGYTVSLDAYTQAELATMLVKAKELFEQNGLGTPKTFRAGGWTAVASTLRALAENGFLVDASACNWARLEEWLTYPDSTLYQWNRQHWGPINDTSQPYFPSEADITKGGEPALPILELPNNGALVDYVTTAEMVEIFRANWDGAALQGPRAYSIGYHPVNFDAEFKRRITDTLTQIDRYLAQSDGGPVVYATVIELSKVWPRP